MQTIDPGRLADPALHEPYPIGAPTPEEVEADPEHFQVWEDGVPVEDDV